MRFIDFEADDAERDELRAQDAFERRRFFRLMQNPDCRDPDHPGCVQCEETEQDEDE